MDYIIVTPAKNEESFLPAVIDSILNQTILPKLWIIVNDGSTDNTPEIIEKLSSKYPWIQSICLPPGERNLRFKYPFVCKSGFDYAIEYCRKNFIDFSYIGLLDADTILEPNYFKKIFFEFQRDPSLGIAGGGLYHKKKMFSY